MEAAGPRGMGETGSGLVPPEMGCPGGSLRSEHPGVPGAEGAGAPMVSHRGTWEHPRRGGGH